MSHLVTAILSSLKTDRGRSLQLGHQNGHHHGISHYIDGVGGDDVYDEAKIEHVPMAANILRHALDRWSTPVNLLRGQTLKALVAQFNDAGLSFASHFGALRALIALGPRVLEEQVLPHLDRYDVHFSFRDFTCLEALIFYHLLFVFSYLSYLDARARLSVDRGFSSSQHASKINELMRGTLVEAARVILRHHYQNPTQDPILKDRRNHTYSWMYSHFGDSLVPVFSNKCIHGGDQIQVPNKGDFGNLKIRAIGKVGTVRGGTPSKSTYSSSTANRLQAETSLPFDIFEPMDTSSSPEKQISVGSEACPKRISEMSCVAFEPVSTYTVTPIRTRTISIVAPGLAPRNRAHLKRKAFQAVTAMSQDTKTAKRLSFIVVGKRSGDMTHLKKRGKRLEIRPRSLISLS